MLLLLSPGLDNWGCGRSGGLFGYVESHQRWIDDVVQFTKSVQHSDIPGFAGLPTFLLGSSLGGCIALHAALAKVRQGQLSGTS